MKIINKRKLVKSFVILILIAISIIMVSRKSYSKMDTEYTERYIYSGDTLWSIAKEEISTNEYFYGKDIRDVVYELKEINNLDNSELNVGEKIKTVQYK